LLKQRIQGENNSSENNSSENKKGALLNAGFIQNLEGLLLVLLFRLAWIKNLLDPKSNGI